MDQDVDCTFIFACKGHGKFIVSEDLAIQTEVGRLVTSSQTEQRFKKNPLSPNSKYKVEQNIQMSPSQCSGIGQNCTKEQRNIYS